MRKYAPQDEDDVELVEGAQYFDNELDDGGSNNINSTQSLITNTHHNYHTSSPASPTSSSVGRSRSTTRSADEIRLRSSFG